MYKCKLKITLSYNSPPGRLTSGVFTNVQIDINVPRGVFIEKKMFKHESLSLSGSTTPPTEQLFVYAQNDLIPNDLKIEAMLTYMQAKNA